MSVSTPESIAGDLVRERFPSVDVARWLEESPYEKREMVDRWKADLITAGVISDDGGILDGTGAAG